MKNYRMLFWQLSRLVLTPLLTASLILLGKLALSPTARLLHTYQAYPRMMETFLACIVLYLAFCVLFMKIHSASLHENGE